jgi:hypothetical protein
MMKFGKPYSKEQQAEYNSYARITFGMICAAWVMVFLVCPLIYEDTLAPYGIFIFFMIFAAYFNVSAAFDYADYGDFRGSDH